MTKPGDWYLTEPDWYWAIVALWVTAWLVWWILVIRHWVGW